MRHFGLEKASSLRRGMTLPSFSFPEMGIWDLFSPDIAGSIIHSRRMGFVLPLVIFLIGILTILGGTFLHYTTITKRVHRIFNADDSAQLVAESAAAEFRARFADRYFPRLREVIEAAKPDPVHFRQDDFPETIALAQELMGHEFLDISLVVTIRQPDYMVYEAKNKFPSATEGEYQATLRLAFQVRLHFQGRKRVSFISFEHDLKRLCIRVDEEKNQELYRARKGVYTPQVTNDYALYVRQGGQEFQSKVARSLDGPQEILKIRTEDARKPGKIFLGTQRNLDNQLSDSHFVFLNVTERLNQKLKLQKLELIPPAPAPLLVEFEDMKGPMPEYIKIYRDYIAALLEEYQKIIDENAREILQGELDKRLAKLQEDLQTQFPAARVTPPKFRVLTDIRLKAMNPEDLGFFIKVSHHPFKNPEGTWNQIDPAGAKQFQEYFTAIAKEPGKAYLANDGGPAVDLLEDGQGGKEILKKLPRRIEGNVRQRFMQKSQFEWRKPERLGLEFTSTRVEIKTDEPAKVTMLGVTEIFPEKTEEVRDQVERDWNAGVSGELERKRLDYEKILRETVLTHLKANPLDSLIDEGNLIAYRRRGNGSEFTDLLYALQAGKNLRLMCMANDQFSLTSDLTFAERNRDEFVPFPKANGLGNRLDEKSGYEKFLPFASYRMRSYIFDTMKDFEGSPFCERDPQDSSHLTIHLNGIIAVKTDITFPPNTEYRGMGVLISYQNIRIAKNFVRMRGLSPDQARAVLYTYNGKIFANTEGPGSIEASLVALHMSYRFPKSDSLGSIDFGGKPANVTGNLVADHLLLEKMGPGSVVTYDSWFSKKPYIFIPIIGGRIRAMQVLYDAGGTS